LCTYTWKSSYFAPQRGWHGLHAYNNGSSICWRLKNNFSVLNYKTKKKNCLKTLKYNNLDFFCIFLKICCMERYKNKWRIAERKLKLNCGHSKYVKEPVKMEDSTIGVQISRVLNLMWLFYTPQKREYVKNLNYSSVLHTFTPKLWSLIYVDSVTSLFNYYNILYVNICIYILIKKYSQSKLCG
jgi:hypothetical protein